MTGLARRLALLEQRQPPAPRRVAIITEGDPRPPDTDFVIVLVAATAESIAA